MKQRPSGGYWKKLIQSVLCWPEGAALCAGGASKKGFGADAELGVDEGGAAAFFGGSGVTCSARV